MHGECVCGGGGAWREGAVTAPSGCHMQTWSSRAGHSYMHIPIPILFQVKTPLVLQADADLVPSAGLFEGLSGQAGACQVRTAV